jgi:outer membrane lipoprotein-sorting protein
MRILLVVLCTVVGTMNLSAENLETILTHMDEAALTFKAISADMQMTTFTKIINDQTVQTGTLKMQRQKEKGTRAILDFSGQGDASIVSFSNHTVRIYYPKLNSYQNYDLGKNSDVLDRFLLLGFGSSGKELSESYEITNAGTETITGQETTKLVLVPKASNVQEKLSKAQVWIPDGKAYPVQQQFFEPTGNYRIVLYNNIKLNPPIKGNLEFKLPAGAKRQGS